MIFYKSNEINYNMLEAKYIDNVLCYVPCLGQREVDVKENLLQSQSFTDLNIDHIEEYQLEEKYPKINVFFGIIHFLIQCPSNLITYLFFNVDVDKIMVDCKCCKSKINIAKKKIIYRYDDGYICEYCYNYKIYKIRYRY